MGSFKPTLGSWGISTKFDQQFNSVKLAVHEMNRGNAIVNLGEWSGVSKDEGFSNAVLIMYAKEMLTTLEHIERYGQAGWIKDDVSFLLNTIRSEYVKLENQDAEQNTQPRAASRGLEN